MLSDRKTVLPKNLIELAKKRGKVKAVIVNAGIPVTIESTKLACELGLIEPIMVGNQKIIEKECKLQNWDIAKFTIINEEEEDNTADIATEISLKENAEIIVKGFIHTDVLLKSVLQRKYRLIGRERVSHVWHMTLNENDKPLIITDGVVNILPKTETKLQIIKHAINFSEKIGINKPKIAILSATEVVLDNIPSTQEAAEITKIANERDFNAEIFGPLAFDNAISPKAAEIKKIKNSVAGKADILLVPSVEMGNALVKMMVYFMGACAAGTLVGLKKPVSIISRSDNTQSRLASIAASIIVS